MGPLILSIASSVFGLRTAPPRVTRHSSLVTRRLSVVGCRLSVVGCRLSVVVHRCSSSLVQRRPDRLDRTNCSVRCATRLALFHIFCWQACGHPAHQAINPLMCKRFCDDVTNASIAARMRIARAARRRTRRSVHVDGSDRARRTTPTALGDHDRFPQFLLASLWTSWVRSAQPVDPARFCRIGRINGSRCRSMPRVPARRAFGRTPLAGLRASAHRIAAALVHIFCGQACGHPTHPPHNPLIRRHFSRHARKEATRPPRTNRRAPPRPRP
ncbi:hypothetical protein X976_1178 [Burkholderia pseudomallei MSHR7500]|nr:hypothetical protein X976_1178 [Burkholderia pseudomallei MSHR7500]